MASKQTNVDMLNSIRASMLTGVNGLNYQDRIPEVTQDNLKDFGQALMDYRPALNEWLNELVNRIGAVFVHKKLYRNKLAFLKRGFLDFGDSIEEIFVDIAKAKHYTPTPPTDNNCDVFEVNKPEVVSAFHRVNRQDQYPISINEEMLKRAFTGWNYFDSFISQIFESIYKADEFDEYLLFKQLIGEVISNSKLVNVTKPVDTATAQAFSIQMRAMGLNLEYLSRDYNVAHVATNTRLEDQILLLRSDIVPVMDVTQLANSFNLNLAQPLSGRIIVIDDFGQGNDDIIGAIIDKDFSMIYDTVYRTDSIYNPKHMYWNFFLHHHQIIASSPFSNCIGFTVATVTPKIESVTLTPASQTIEAGYSNTIQAYVKYVGDIDASLTWSISGNNSANTKVDDGSVYVGADESATALTVTATSVSDSTVSGTATVNVIGQTVEPEDPEEPDTPGGEG